MRGGAGYPRPAMKDILTSYVAYFITTLANFVVGVLAARLLLPVGRGELGQVMLWPTLIAALGAFSVYDGIIYFIAGRRENSARVMGSALTLGALLSVVLCAIGYFLTPYLHSDGRAEVANAAYLYLLYIPLGFWGSYMVAAFQGHLSFTLWNLLRSSLSVTYAIYAVMFWLLDGASIHGFVISVLLANATVLVGGAILLHQRHRIGLRPERRIMAGLLSYGVRLHIAELLTLASQRVDQILIARWLPPQEFGFYLVALAVSGAASGTVLVLGGLVFPKIAAESDLTARVAALGRYLRLAIGLSVPGAVALFLLAKWFVIVVYGAAYGPAVPALRLFAIGLVPLACKGLLTQTFKAFGRPKTIMLAEVIGLVTITVGLVLLVPVIGIVGAAVALVAAQTVACIVFLAAIRNGMGVRLRPLLTPTADDVRLVIGQLRALRARSPT
jgi:O-antigen/teichoic acid export membrane protein